MAELKNIVITGSTSGLGLETAKKIAKDKDYRIVIAAYTKESGERAKKEIEEETGNSNLAVLTVDTSLLSSVREFVEEFKKLNIRIDALVLDAGISQWHSGTTKEGFELVFATNYLGHFLMAGLLLPYINDGGRIVTLSSDMHNPPGGMKWMDPEEVAHPKAENKNKYSYSKLYALMYARTLDKKLKAIGKKIDVNAFNPGMMNTTGFFGKEMTPFIYNMIKLFMPKRIGNQETSSTALKDVIISPKLSGISGEYFDRSTNTIKTSKDSYNEEYMNDLWNKSVKWTGLKEEETISGIL